MNDALPELTEQYASALHAYLAEPGEAGRMRAYDLGRRALSHEVGIAVLGVLHGEALAAALASADAHDERARLIQRAAEFQGEALAPFEMMLRGAQETNTLLQSLNKTLEQRVEERTQQLAEAARRKDEFLAMLAHELRNPLAPIRNTLHLMRLDSLDAAAVEQSCELMERQVHHLVRLVDDLMDVSRITQGKIELRKELLDLATIVQSALEISRPHIESAGHVLSVTLPAEPIYLQADATRLAQVVANLLNNATKYTEPDGRIWLTVERDGDQAVCRVRDTGSGIPAEMLPRIFDMFVQVTSSLERSQGGVGIGLTLVKGLVEMHGGTVMVHSAGPGKGSEFVIRLPTTTEVKEQGPQGSADNSAKVAANSKSRILVVDDNRDAADSLGMLLRFLGNEVRTAHDGLEAVGEAVGFQPDVVLLDIGLPKLNGYEAARKIRDARGGEVLLIAITGWGQEEDRRRSQEAGFDHHMVKPIELDALQEVLRQHGGLTKDRLPARS